MIENTAAEGANSQTEQKQKTKDFSVAQQGTQSHTTLTIVQDFPKKQVEQAAAGASNVNLVQGKAKSGDFMVVEPTGSHQPTTTLTIVQEFPK